MRYAIYARKSTESEERQIQSIDDQVRLARALLGDAPAEVITEAMSAKEPDRRPEFRRLVELVERGRIDTVVAWHPDRLSRNEMDAAKICYLVRTGRLDLRFANYFFDNSPEGMMMLQMALSQSQYYSSKLSKDVRRGLDSRIAKGWWPGKAPEGYLNDLEAHSIVPDPERFPLIERAFRLLHSGAYTVNEVLVQMNEEWGYRTKRRKNTGGGKLSKSAAYRLFSDVFYAGYMEIRGEIHKGAHPPVLTLDEFRQVQEMIRTRQAYSKHDEFVYKGLIRCFHCGRMAASERQGGRHGRGSYVYYRCGNPDCPPPRPSIREDKVEAEIDRRLRDLTWPSAFKAVLLQEFEEWLGSEYGDVEEVAKQRKAAVEAFERKRAGLLEMRLNGEVDRDHFVSKDQELQREIERLKVESSKAEDAVANARRTMQVVAEFLVHAHNTFQVGTMKNKREIAAAMGAAYRLRDGELLVDYNPLLPPFQRNFEPLKTGSDKQKGPTFAKSVPHGWAGGNGFEAFREATRGQCLPEVRFLS